MKTITLLTFMLISVVACAADFQRDTIKAADGNPITITFFGHGSLSMSYGNELIYIDPVSEFANYAELPKADIVLITHDHGDHLDKRALDDIVVHKTEFVSNATSAAQLKGAKVLANGESCVVGNGVKVESVAAYNTTPGRDVFHPKGRDNGYIVTLGGTRIYISGDTETICEMANFGKIDIAFLPVNQPYTMTPVQAAEAAKIIKPAVLYPYHTGDTDIRQLDELLKDSAIEIRYRKMQ